MGASKKAASKGRGRPRGSVGTARSLPNDVLELRGFGLVTAAEVARALGIELGTVIKRIRNGQYPGVERPAASDRFRFFVILRAFLESDLVYPSTPSHDLLKALEAKLPAPKAVKPIPPSFTRFKPGGLCG